MLEVITDKERIVDMIPEIREILNREYAYFGLGKWNGPVSNTYLKEIATEIKIASNADGMSACAVYAGNFGGNKAIGVAGNTALADAGETLLETMPVLAVIHVPG